MSIQDKVVEQISSVNQRINSGNYSQKEINDLLTSAQQVVDESLESLNKLNLPDKVKGLADQTKHYLEGAKGLYAQMQQLVGQFDQLKEQGMDMTSKMTTQAQEIFTQQVQNAQQGLNSFKMQLDQLSNELMDTKNQIEKQYQSQT